MTRKWTKLWCSESATASDVLCDSKSRLFLMSAIVGSCSLVSCTILSVSAFSNLAGPSLYLYSYPYSFFVSVPFSSFHRFLVISPWQLFCILWQSFTWHVLKCLVLLRIVLPFAAVQVRRGKFCLFERLWLQLCSAHLLVVWWQLENCVALQTSEVLRHCACVCVGHMITLLWFHCAGVVHSAVLCYLYCVIQPSVLTARHYTFICCHSKL